MHEIEEKTPLAIELFNQETTVRKLIHDLVSPILDKLSSDRQQMLSTVQRNRLLEERLAKCEHALGMCHSKPPVFQAIADEIAEVKAGMREQGCEFKGKLQAIARKGERVEEEMSRWVEGGREKGERVESLEGMVEAHREEMG